MSSSSSRWVPRFGLRSLLVVVLFIAVLLAWYVDHRRHAEALRLAQVEIEIYARQNQQLKTQLANSWQRGGSGLTIYFWASADEFIQALTHTADEEEFLGMAGSLGSSGETVLDETVQRLIVLLADRDERTRKRAVVTLSFLKQRSRALATAEYKTTLEIVLARHADEIARGLVPLLDNREVSGSEAYGTLRLFGPDAASALDVLREKMADDSNYYAVWAAEAVAAIDPQADIGPRLIELIEQDHPDWRYATSTLPDHVPPAEARRILTALYDRLEQEGDRQTIISALNKIPAETSVAAPTP